MFVQVLRLRCNLGCVEVRIVMVFWLFRLRSYPGCLVMWVVWESWFYGCLVMILQCECLIVLMPYCGYSYCMCQDYGCSRCMWYLPRYPGFLGTLVCVCIQIVCKQNDIFKRKDRSTVPVYFHCDIG